MPIKQVLLAAFVLVPITAGAAIAEEPLSYYLPDVAGYDDSVPKPSSVLGWEVGSWHVRHDQLVAYMRRLAEASDRVRIEVTGKTYEERPLLVLTISSPRNLARIDEIREEHLRLADPSAAKPDTSSMPIVVYLGYSIHGNEASGSNASLLVAYHLAAAQGGEVESWLDDAVVLLDPSFNPDGLSRFAHWANTHRGRVLVADSNHREHTEGWPNGRTNHYWFDLNRDWLPSVHPESRARLETYHRWKPNVLIDAHEMGSDQTYFFQPGIPVRQNPLTPARNLELTREIASYHAAALDEIGSLYFTEEVFDDYYYGKGSTYPDVNGTIGILFEQGSARGHVQESINGEVTFPFAIRNQLTTSLSTLRASLDKRREILDYQAEFYRDGREDDGLRAYVFGDALDPLRTHRLLELLRRHRVEAHVLARDLESGGARFEAGRAYVVPLAQTQHRLVRALFEKRVSFADSSFYDVSTWTLPLAYGLPYVELDKAAFDAGLLGESAAGGPAAGGPAAEPESPRGRIVSGDGTAVAYAFDWDGYLAPRALYRLLDAEVRCRVATRPFTAATPEGRREFGYGTIVVPLGIQDAERSEVEELLSEGAQEDAVDVWAVTTGLTPEGVDIGSPSLRALETPKPALVVGGRTNVYEAGELWHLLDRRYEIPLTLLEADRLRRVDLGEYSHLLLVDGDYGDAPEELMDRLRRWVDGGGVLIATKGAAVWAGERFGGAAAPDGSAAPDAAAPDAAAPDAAAPAGAPAAGGQAGEEAPPERLPYAEQRARFQAEVISGAIFEVELDTTHPIAYGYRRATLPVFRNSTLFLEPPNNPYATVAQYSAEPLLSGYVSTANLDKIRGAPAVIALPMGEGAVVRIVDDPNFRGFWYGTNRLVLNALFFGGIIETDRGRR